MPAVKRYSLGRTWNYFRSWMLHIRFAKTYFQNEVQLHILNNAQNGYCPEDCGYCAQASSATTDIEAYPLKPDAEILEEAKRAYESGAYRYCIVLSGRGPSPKRVSHLADLIHTVKTHYPIEVCLSAGLIDMESAYILKAAGLDRLNHNLNTSEAHYPNICSTHTYQDRMETLQAAQTVGLACCSGVIVGMGEETDDLIQVAKSLRQLKVASLPVNFFLTDIWYTIVGACYGTAECAYYFNSRVLSPSPVSVPIPKPTSRDKGRCR